MAISWMKQGEASKALVQKEAVALELRKEESGKLYRFFMSEGEAAALTFVDGDLSPEGFLLPPRFYEHNVKIHGKFGNTFVCPEQTDPSLKQKCPLCEGGDRPYLAALFTVIDHRSFPSTKEAGKTYANTRKLLVVKPESFEMLNKLAIEHNGLIGARFEVARSGDRSAAIGSAYTFVNKTPVAELEVKYTRTYTPKDGEETTVCDFTVADYEAEITFRSEEELRLLGFGKNAVSGGVSGYSNGKPATSTPAGNVTQAGPGTDYASQL